MNRSPEGPALIRTLVQLGNALNIDTMTPVVLVEAGRPISRGADIGQAPNLDSAVGDPLVVRSYPH
jgi:hypothetical protein